MKNFKHYARHASLAKRVLALVLIFTMCFSMIQITAWADANNANHTYGKGECSVCKNGSSQSSNHDFDDNGICKCCDPLYRGSTGTGTDTTEPDIAPCKHEWITEIYNEPTCTEKGNKAQVCTKCGAKDKNESPPELGHEWDSSKGEVTKEATCTEAGIKTLTCQRDGCDATKTEEIPATGNHKWGGWVSQATAGYKEPTCEGAGEKQELRTCSVCGKKETRTVTLDALGHDWSAWQNPHNDLYKHYRYCRRNGCVYALTEYGQMISAGIHTWGAWKKQATGASKAPTCVEAGYYTEGRSCPECGKYETRQVKIPATGEHKYSEELKEAGTGHAHICEVCGAKDDWKVHNLVVTETKATCSENGRTVYTCADCGFTMTTTTPKLDHTWGAWKEQATGASKAPTCTEDGFKTEIHTCAVCLKANETRQVTVKALDHDYGDWQVITTGYTQHQRVCSHDNSHVEVEAHHFTDWATIETVEEENEYGTRTITVQSRICSDCNYSETQRVSDDCAHPATARVTTTTPATCTEDGAVVTVCNSTKCDGAEIARNIIPATGHAYGNWTQNGAAGHVHVCANNAEHTETAEHTYGEWVTTIYPDYGVLGERQHSCTECGYVESDPLSALIGPAVEPITPTTPIVTPTTPAPVPVITPDPAPSQEPEPTDEPTDEPIEIVDPTQVPMGPTPDVEPTEEPEPSDEPIEIDEPTEVPLGPGPITQEPKPSDEPKAPAEEQKPAQNPVTSAPGDEEIEDDVVPLAAAPKTGDDYSMYLMLMIASGCGLMIMGLKSLRKREEK